MSYPDAEYYITFLTQCYKDFEVSLEPVVCIGHPKKYSDMLLIIFFAIMALKQINYFKAQPAFLVERPDWMKRPKFKSVPHRTTLSRRYKQLSEKINVFHTLCKVFVTQCFVNLYFYAYPIDVRSQCFLIAVSLSVPPNAKRAFGVDLAGMICL